MAETKKATGNTTENKETFESKLKKMENISKLLQDPDTELEKAVDLYEEGMKIAKELDTQLSAIERRIEIVTSSCDEEQIITEPYK